jgi:hypothetical protein
MSTSGRTALKALALTKIPGGSKTTAEQMRDVINDIVDSVANLIDEKNAANGYPGLGSDSKVLPSVLPIETGTRSFSGNGSITDFVISHTIGTAPSFMQVMPLTQDSSDRHWIHAATGANVTVRFMVPPAAGTNNVSFNFLFLK